MNNSDLLYIQWPTTVRIVHNNIIQVFQLASVINPEELV